MYWFVQSTLFKISKFFSFVPMNPMIWIRENTVKIIEDRFYLHADEVNTASILFKSYKIIILSLNNIKTTSLYLLKHTQQT